MCANKWQYSLKFLGETVALFLEDFFKMQRMERSVPFKITNSIKFYFPVANTLVSFLGEHIFVCNLRQLHNEDKTIRSYISYL